VRLAEHVGLMRREIYIGIWWKIHTERDHWEDIDIAGKILFKWILEE
jgi:hypothetical protein